MINQILNAVSRLDHRAEDGPASSRSESSTTEFRLPESKHAPAQSDRFATDLSEPSKDEKLINFSSSRRVDDEATASRPVTEAGSESTPSARSQAVKSDEGLSQAAAETKAEPSTRPASKPSEATGPSEPSSPVSGLAEAPLISGGDAPVDSSLAAASASQGANQVKRSAGLTAGTNDLTRAVPSTASKLHEPQNVTRPQPMVQQPLPSASGDAGGEKSPVSKLASVQPLAGPVAAHGSAEPRPAVAAGLSQQPQTTTAQTEQSTPSLSSAKTTDPSRVLAESVLKNLESIEGKQPKIQANPDGTRVAVKQTMPIAEPPSAASPAPAPVLTPVRQGVVPVSERNLARGQAPVADLAARPIQGDQVLKPQAGMDSKPDGQSFQNPASQMFANKADSPVPSQQSSIGSSGSGSGSGSARVAEFTAALDRHLGSLASSSRGNIRLALDLPNGQRLNVALQMSGGNISVKFTGANDAQLRQDLSQAWNRLSTNAAQRGLQLAQPSFDLPTANTQQSDSARHQSHNQQQGEGSNSSRERSFGESPQHQQQRDWNTEDSSEEFDQTFADLGKTQGRKRSE